MADAKFHLADQRSGRSRYVRTDFRAAGQNSWQDPPTQNEDEFELLTNVLPAESGNLERRWGYSALNTSFFSSPAVSRAAAAAVYQNDAANTRKIVWPAIPGANGTKATEENGTAFNGSVYTSTNAVPRMANSRNYGYFTSGHASDTPTKWDGSSSSGTSNWGIVAPTGAANSGVKTAGSSADDGGTFGPWTTMTLTTISDNTYAVSGTVSVGNVSSVLRLYNFTSGVPTGATILGVEVAVESKKTVISGTPIFSGRVGLSIDGTNVSGTSKTLSAAEVTTSDSTTTKGGSTDTWGNTFTASDLAASNFSLLFWFIVTGSGSETWSIDYVTVKVYYTTPITIADSAGSVTLVSGRKYYYVYTNSTTGHLSGLSLVSASSGPVTTQQLDLSNIIASSNSQVDYKIILATADGGDETLLYYIGTLANAVTTYTDNVTEADLLAQNIYLELNEFGDEIGVSDNDPPLATGQFPTKHRGRMYTASGQNLYFSKSQDELTTSTGITVGKWEEAFPPDFFFDISEGAETIAGLMSDGETLYIGTERRVIRLLGDGPNNFQKPETLFQNVGILNQDVWKMVFRTGNPLGVMWLTPSNRVVISDFNTYEDIGWPIQDVLDTVNKTYAAKCWAMYSSHSIYNLYILALVTGANTQPDTLCVYDIEMKKWYIWQPTDKMLGGLYHIDVTGVPFTYLLAASGKLYKLDPSVTQDRTGDTPLNFDVTIQTSWLDFGDPTLRKVLNELEVMTGDSSLAVTIQGASNISEFTTPAAVATSAALTTGPLGEYKLMLAGKTTKDRYYKLKFVSSGTSQVDVLDGFSLELFPLHRI